MAFAIRRLLVRTLLHLHLLGKVVPLFRQQPVVVLAKVARLLPQLRHLGVFSLGDGPDPLPLALVPLAILFDPLLDLSLIQAVRRGPPPGFRLGARRVRHVHVAVGGREAQVVIVCPTLLDDVLNLRNHLVLEEALVLEPVQDLIDAAVSQRGKAGGG